MKNLLYKLFCLAIMFTFSCNKDEVNPNPSSTNLDGTYHGTATTLVKSTGQTMIYPVRVEITPALWMSNTNKENNPFHLNIVPDPNTGHEVGQVLVESAAATNNAIVNFWSYSQQGEDFAGELSPSNPLGSRNYIVFMDPGLGQPFPYNIDRQATIQGGLANDSLIIKVAGNVNDPSANKIAFETNIAVKRAP